MKRNHFLIISSLLAWIFGLAMIFVPDSTIAPVSSVNLGMQSFGIAFFSIGVINFFSRNDPGSKALKAVMFGNIILHLGGEAFDVYDYTAGYTQLSGILGSGIIHILLFVGFTYYLLKIPKYSEPESIA
jgi:hypothetical protein